MGSLSEHSLLPFSTTSISSSLLLSSSSSARAKPLTNPLSPSTLTSGPNQSSQTVFTWLASTNTTLPSPPSVDISELLYYLFQNSLLPSGNIYLGSVQFGSETFHSTENVSFLIDEGFAMELASGGKPGPPSKATIIVPIIVVVLLILLAGVVWWKRRDILWWIRGWN